MKRRDFLRLAAGALTSLGLGINDANDQVTGQWTERIISESPHRVDWSGGSEDVMPLDDGSIEAIIACEPPYMCAFNGDTVIESFDGGLTWSEMDINGRLWESYSDGKVWRDLSDANPA